MKILLLTVSALLLIPHGTPTSLFQKALYSFRADAFSCKQKCGVEDRGRWPCQCHAKCHETVGGCCPDFHILCLSCRGRCGSRYSKQAPCQCNTKCPKYRNCCPDFGKCTKLHRAHLNGFELAPDDSCIGRCGDGVDPSKPCQCNVHCKRFNDCCSDYDEVCLEAPGSCKGRCEDKLDPTKPCQCNKPCVEHGDCCTDYAEVCDGNTPTDPPPGYVSDDVLAAISEDLFSLDVSNNVAPLITVRIQGKVLGKPGDDNAPLPLLEVNPVAYERPTISRLLALHDNYVADVKAPEDETSQEKAEIEAFLDAILSTPIMIKTAAFLAQEGFIPNDFRSTFRRIWFGFYSRANGVAGSTAFEHVFMGELKNGVSGFHHWAFWAREEIENRLNYKGYIDTLDLGNKGMVISESFDWRNAQKPISSMFIGTSPEFELGIYTICWYARPNTLCPIVLNSKKLKIQTYDIGYNGQKYVATAYPQDF